MKELWIIIRSYLFAVKSVLIFFGVLRGSFFRDIRANRYPCIIPWLEIKMIVNKGVIVKKAVPFYGIFCLTLIYYICYSYLERKRNDKGNSLSDQGCAKPRVLRRLKVEAKNPKE